MDERVGVVDCGRRVVGLVLFLVGGLAGWVWVKRKTDGREQKK